MVDVIESLCFVEASPDWDEEKMGFPPVAMQHGYQLWIDHDQASQMSDDLACTVDLLSLVPSPSRNRQSIWCAERMISTKL
jgi:hypothetical protein